MEDRYFIVAVGNVTEPDASDAEIISEIESNVEGAYRTAHVRTLALSPTLVDVIKEGLLRVIKAL